MRATSLDGSCVQRPGRRAAPRPSAAAISRASARSSVDLPQPLAPTIAVMRPGGDVEVEVVDDDAVAVGERDALGRRAVRSSVTASLRRGWS